MFLFTGDGWIHSITTNGWKQLTHLPKSRPRYTKITLKFRHFKLRDSKLKNSVLKLRYRNTLQSECGTI